jgi:outer membrane receptor protein involved in Fe transport
LSIAAKPPSVAGSSPLYRWLAGSLLAFTTAAAAGPAPTSDHTVVHVLPAFTVTASRAPLPLSTLAVPVTSISGTDVRQSLVLDAALGRIPNFSLFRRTPSLAANPTTQGASLRGIGPSGASRALVLLDGIPFNDPFGGWVQWGWINLATVERVEVLRGGGSASWGNTALGGVIQIVPRSPVSSDGELSFHFGSHQLAGATVYSSSTIGALGVAVHAHRLSTDGFHRVRSDQRGSVDVATHARHMSAGIDSLYSFSNTSKLVVRGSLFHEDRGNGTPLANNSTRAWRVHARLDWGPDAVWRADAYASGSDFANTFTAVAADRSTERLVLDQYAVPARAFGGSIRRHFSLGETGHWLLGSDFRSVHGETREFVVFQAADRYAGGRQSLAGLFAEVNGTTANSVLWQLAVRGDRWSVLRGFLAQPNAQRQYFADRYAHVLNARGSVSFPINPLLRVRGAAYQAYRVPTINELYRPFQVDADVTQANPGLHPERLLGLEAGVVLSAGRPFLLALTTFLNEVHDPILNVTVGRSVQGGDLRQRRNVDRSQILGFELDLRAELAPLWQVDLALALTNARIVAASQPDLVNRRLAQVPRHVLTARLVRQSGASGLGGHLALRWAGSQFEDDRNLRSLAAYCVVDLAVSFRISPGRVFHLAVDNVFNQRFADSMSGSGIVTVAAPRQLRASLAWSL